MKQRILTLSLLLMTAATAYAFLRWTGPTNTEAVAACAQPYETKPITISPSEVSPSIDFIYAVDHRFVTTITRENLRKAQSIIDLIPTEATTGLSDYREVKVDLIPNYNMTALQGENEFLTSAQLELLGTADYSSNFYFESHCKNMGAESGALEDYHLVYYVTVVPEQTATYPGGMEALAQYLRENSEKELSWVQWNSLRPGQITFTVTKEGKISNVEMTSTCGTLVLDNHLTNLIWNTPQDWTPARNHKGEPVDQELVFFYGMKGC